MYNNNVIVKYYINYDLYDRLVTMTFHYDKFKYLTINSFRDDLKKKIMGGCNLQNCRLEFEIQNCC